jgi:hypothetical protein
VRFTAPVGHDLEECKTSLDRKKMPPPAVPVPQEPRQSDHRREDSDGVEQMVEINVIFGGRHDSNPQLIHIQAKRAWYVVLQVVVKGRLIPVG